MRPLLLLQSALFFVICWSTLDAQKNDSLIRVSGIVYDPSFHPLPGTHVIAMNSGRGEITDTLGIFSLEAGPEEILLFRNISFRDTLIPVRIIREFGSVTMQYTYYPLREARIFNWGSTYGEFKEAVSGMEEEVPLGEKLGLPRQDPDYIPYDMDEQKIKSLGFLIHSPVSFLYHNLSRKQRSARKVYRMEQTEKEREDFYAVYNEKTISEITGLEGEELEAFMIYLNEKFSCDYTCSELKIYQEIYSIWEYYRSHQ